jgi:hypothetical protein
VVPPAAIPAPSPIRAPHPAAPPPSTPASKTVPPLALPLLVGPVAEAPPPGRTRARNSGNGRARHFDGAYRLLRRRRSERVCVHHPSRLTTLCCLWVWLRKTKRRLYRILFRKILHLSTKCRSCLCCSYLYTLFFFLLSCHVCQTLVEIAVFGNLH